MRNDGLTFHIEELKHRHSHLELELNHLLYSHGDELQIQELKKQKLRLKDEITLLESKING